MTSVNNVKVLLWIGKKIAKNSKRILHERISMAVLTEAVWCEPAVNKGGNTRFQLSSFSYKKGEGFLRFYALGKQKV